MRNLTLVEIEEITGGDKHPINWWRAGFNVTLGGLVGIVAGGLLGVHHGGKSPDLIISFVGFLAEGMYGAAIGAGVGMGAGAAYAAIREYYFSSK